jgi:hypothetical protein
MKLLSALIALALVSGGVGWAARCTTVLDSSALREYEIYVARAERDMPARFAGSELSWVPEYARKEAAAEMEAGKSVRRNISEASTNQRVSEWNGTVVHWVGAARIRRATLEDFRAVLEDYGRYSTVYRPLIYDCRAQRIDAPAGSAYDVTFGFQNAYRAASIFPQHYSFEVKSRTDYSDEGSPADPVLVVHSRSNEIRESDSGVPGRNDLLEPHHDHGILWALNTYWRARQKGPDLYVEFEAITLARSIQEFMCKIGIIPIPKAIVSRVMDSLPGESVELMLAATKAECERKVSHPRARASRE